MKNTLKAIIVCCMAAVFAATALVGCMPARHPENYYLNDSTALPEEIELGDYYLASLKYRSFRSTANYVDYFNHFKDSEVQLRNSIFQMGETIVNSPKYHELMFEGVIRAAGTKNDHYRPVSPDAIKDFDMDETKHEVKRCIAVFDSEDNDTGYRLYIFDDELWIGFFEKTNDIDWMCADVFVLKKEKRFEIK